MERRLLTPQTATQIVTYAVFVQIVPGQGRLADGEGVRAEGRLREPHTHQGAEGLGRQNPVRVIAGLKCSAAESPNWPRQGRLIGELSTSAHGA